MDIGDEWILIGYRRIDDVFTRPKWCPVKGDPES
jgi:hypothetical protein